MCSSLPVLVCSPVCKEKKNEESKETKLTKYIRGKVKFVQFCT